MNNWNKWRECIAGLAALAVMVAAVIIAGAADSIGLALVGGAGLMVVCFICGCIADDDIYSGIVDAAVHYKHMKNQRRRNKIERKWHAQEMQNKKQKSEYERRNQRGAADRQRQKQGLARAKSGATAER